MILNGYSHYYLILHHLLYDELSVLSLLLLLKLPQNHLKELQFYHQFSNFKQFNLKIFCFHLFKHSSLSRSMWVTFFLRGYLYYNKNIQLLCFQRLVVANPNNFHAWLFIACLNMVFFLYL
jgi:hypothetical protein